MLSGIFEDTLLSRKVHLRSSLFMRPMHPKTEIRPTAESIQKILDAGWVGQLKIHGHRAQIHIPSEESEEVFAYNRQGQLHKKVIPPVMLSELRRVFTPAHGWNVIDAEWIKSEEKLFIFDFLKKDGKSLGRLNFQDRWKMLPRAYLSPSMQTLPVLSSLAQCLNALAKPEAYIEGLVFKSSSPGFEDTSIIRCRRSPL
jgi:ATP-dependent DNA ligase